jgi:ankyrin repeat protein
MEYVTGPPLKAAESLFFYSVSNSKASDVIKLLSDNEVHPNVRNPSGTTALHLACHHQCSNMAKILVHFGAALDLQEEAFVGKKAPIHLAVSRNNYDISKILLDAGADPNIKDAAGCTP